VNTTIRQIGVLLMKDVRIEVRAKQTIGLVVILGVLIVVVLGLGLGESTAARAGFSATSVLWVAYLFGGTLCFEKTMEIERTDDALAGLLLAPIDRGVIYLAKLLANLLLMATLSLVITPLAIVLFRFNLGMPIWEFALVIGLGLIGFAIVGTLFAAVVSSSRLRGGLLAMVVFPLTLPVVIITTQLLRARLAEGGSIDLNGVATLVLFDVIFLVVSWMVFDLVLEP
jgi:heme exporter protein B